MVIKLCTNCTICGKSFSCECESDGYQAWKAGALIQNALPELSPSDREMLISGVCDTCFDDIFKDDYGGGLPSTI